MTHFQITHQRLPFSFEATLIYCHFNHHFLSLIGGIVGVSSVLMIQSHGDGIDSSKKIVIMLMIKMHGTNLTKAACEISKLLRDGTRWLDVEYRTICFHGYDQKNKGVKYTFYSFLYAEKSKLNHRLGFLILWSFYGRAFQYLKLVDTFEFLNYSSTYC